MSMLSADPGHVEIRVNPLFRRRLRSKLLNRRPSINFKTDINTFAKTSESVVAQFLSGSATYDAVSFGILLGQRSLLGDAVRRAFLQTFDFSGMRLDHALREFMAAFRLPGEAQMIDRVMQSFADRYNACFPSAFEHADTAYVLSFSLIMLNTDHHSSHVRKKMTLADWIKNNRELDGGKDLPRALLIDLYESLCKSQLKFTPIEASAAIEEPVI